MNAQGPQLEPEPMDTLSYSVTILIITVAAALSLAAVLNIFTH